MIGKFWRFVETRKHALVHIRQALETDMPTAPWLKYIHGFLDTSVQHGCAYAVQSSMSKMLVDGQAHL